MDYLIRIHLPVLLYTLIKGKCDVRTFQCSFTHLLKVNVACAPSSAPLHIC